MLCSMLQLGRFHQSQKPRLGTFALHPALRRSSSVACRASCDQRSPREDLRPPLTSAAHSISRPLLPISSRAARPSPYCARRLKPGSLPPLLLEPLNPPTANMPTPESELFLKSKPTVPPTFANVDMKDHAAVLKARDAIIREQWVQIMMKRLVGEELGKCYRKEGVNHLEKCGKYRGESRPQLMERRCAKQAKRRSISTATPRHQGPRLHGPAVQLHARC